MAVKKLTKKAKREARVAVEIEAGEKALRKAMGVKEGASPAKARMNLGLPPESPKGQRIIKIPSATGSSGEDDSRRFEPKVYRVGDRVWYKGETWYVKADRGGNFVSIRDWPRTGAEDGGDVPKATVQSVPRVTLRKNDVIPAGNGLPMSDDEKSFKKRFDEPRKKRREDAVLFTDKELTTKPEKGKKHTREPHDPNLIPLKKICGDVNVDPKLARRLLRAEKSIPRPEGRWEFSKADVDRIKKVITQPIK